MRLTSSLLLLHLVVRRLSWTSTAISELTMGPTLEAVDSLRLTLWVQFILSVCPAQLLFCYRSMARSSRCVIWYFYNAQLLTSHRHSASNGADAEQKRTHSSPWTSFFCLILPVSYELLSSSYFSYKMSRYIVYWDLGNFLVNQHWMWFYFISTLQKTMPRPPRTSECSC